MKVVEFACIPLDDKFSKKGTEDPEIKNQWTLMDQESIQRNKIKVAGNLIIGPGFLKTKVTNSSMNLQFIGDSILVVDDTRILVFDNYEQLLFKQQSNKNPAHKSLLDVKQTISCIMTFEDKVCIQTANSIHIYSYIQGEFKKLHERQAKMLYIHERTLVLQGSYSLNLDDLRETDDKHKISENYEVKRKVGDYEYVCTLVKMTDYDDDDEEITVYEAQITTYHKNKQYRVGHLDNKFPKRANGDFQIIELGHNIVFISGANLTQGSFWRDGAEIQNQNEPLLINFHYQIRGITAKQLTPQIGLKVLSEAKVLSRFKTLIILFENGELSQYEFIKINAPQDKTDYSHATILPASTISSQIYSTDRLVLIENLQTDIAELQKPPYNIEIRQKLVELQKTVPNTNNSSNFNFSIPQKNSTNLFAQPSGLLNTSTTGNPFLSVQTPQTTTAVQQEPAKQLTNLDIVAKPFSIQNSNKDLMLNSRSSRLMVQFQDLHLIALQSEILVINNLDQIPERRIRVTNDAEEITLLHVFKKDLLFIGTERQILTMDQTLTVKNRILTISPLSVMHHQDFVLIQTTDTAYLYEYIGSTLKEKSQFQAIASCLYIEQKLQVLRVQDGGKVQLSKDLVSWEDIHQLEGEFFHIEQIHKQYFYFSSASINEFQIDQFIIELPSKRQLNLMPESNINEQVLHPDWNILHIGNIVTIFCSYSQYGYALQIIDGELVPLLDARQEQVILPCNQNIVKGMCGVEFLWPTESEQLEIMREGRPSKQQRLPSILQLEWDDYKQDILLHRYILLNLNANPQQNKALKYQVVKAEEKPQIKEEKQKKQQPHTITGQFASKLHSYIKNVYNQLQSTKDPDPLDPRDSLFTSSMQLNELKKQILQKLKQYRAPQLDHKSIEEVDKFRVLKAYADFIQDHEVDLQDNITLVQQDLQRQNWIISYYKAIIKYNQQQDGQILIDQALENIALAHQKSHDKRKGHKIAFDDEEIQIPLKIVPQRPIRFVNLIRAPPKEPQLPVIQDLKIPSKVVSGLTTQHSSQVPSSGFGQQSQSQSGLSQLGQIKQTDTTKPNVPSFQPSFGKQQPAEQKTTIGFQPSLGQKSTTEQKDIFQGFKPAEINFTKLNTGTGGLGLANTDSGSLPQNWKIEPSNPQPAPETQKQKDDKVQTQVPSVFPNMFATPQSKQEVKVEQRQTEQITPQAPKQVAPVQHQGFIQQQKPDAANGEKQEQKRSLINTRSVNDMAQMNNLRNALEEAELSDDRSKASETSNTVVQPQMMQEKIEIPQVVPLIAQLSKPETVAPVTVNPIIESTSAQQTAPPFAPQNQGPPSASLGLFQSSNQQIQFGSFQQGQSSSLINQQTTQYTGIQNFGVGTQPGGSFNVNTSTFGQSASLLKSNPVLGQPIQKLQLGQFGQLPGAQQPQQQLSFNLGNQGTSFLNQQNIQVPLAQTIAAPRK